MQPCLSLFNFLMHFTFKNEVHVAQPKKTLTLTHKTQAKKMSQKQNLLANFKEAELVNICSFLTGKDLCAVALSSSHFYNALKLDSTWSVLVRSHWRHSLTHTMLVRFIVILNYNFNFNLNFWNFFFAIFLGRSKEAGT